MKVLSFRTASLALPFLFLHCASPPQATQGMLSGRAASALTDSVELDRLCDIDDAGACFLAKGELRLDPALRVPIVQGVAPPTKAVFAILLPAASEGFYFVFDPAKKELLSLSPAHNFAQAGSAWKVVRIEATGLEPTKDYQFLVADGTGHLIDVRSFRTLDAREDTFRFALMGGTNGSTQLLQENWRPFQENLPSALFFLGDSLLVEANQKEHSPLELWEKYAHARRTQRGFFSLRLIPFVATWDDHDFGMLEGDSTYPHLNKAREILEAFFPTYADEKVILSGPGVSKAIKIAGHTFVLFDNRSFRSPNHAPSACRKKKNLSYCPDTPGSNEEESHFGRVQTEWALSLVAKSDGPTWLMSGDQWFGDYHPFESFAGNHPQDFRNFLARLKKSKNRHLLFASGSPLNTELFRVRPFSPDSYSTYELSGNGMSLGSRAFHNPQQVLGECQASAYLVVESVQAKKDFQLSVQAYDLESRPCFQNNLKLGRR